MLTYFYRLFNITEVTEDTEDTYSGSYGHVYFILLLYGVSVVR